ncbi:hypothetical protein ACOT81_03460 [Streptomyces sp. WI04-05B]|uniref:hypothetical protein n=1 Tax=Streptomyces TaxID=1883 RepID=UPI0029B72973|nr:MULTISPECIES: hypothetical protein [unclassified Streptomyces]MDX2549032.1 hypothetical protein [Streptomyces sp. WI04-05B]MDX2583309.1 hypothetical protein [Streptomyces sp. WI04-05A]
MLTEFRLVGCARRGPTDFDQACEILWGTLYGIASLSYLGSVGNDRARSLVEQALRTILLGRRTETPPNGRPANSQVLRPLWFAGFRGRTGAFVEFVFVGLPIDRDDVEEAQETAFELDGEVTGTGSGTGRCHLDLEIAESRARPRPRSGSGRCCPNWSRGLRDVERRAGRGEFGRDSGLTCP